MRVSKFGVVGLLNFVFEAILFNILFLSLGVPEVWAKVLSTLVSIVIAYILNKTWVFQHAKRSSVREAGVFLGVNLGCMAFSAFLFHLLLQWDAIFALLGYFGIGYVLAVNFLNFGTIVLMIPVRYFVYAVLFRDESLTETQSLSD